MATDTIVNTGAEGDRMQKMVIPGSLFAEMPYAPPSIKMDGRLSYFQERQIPLWFMPAATRLVHGHALDTTLNGGYQYVHNGGTSEHGKQ